MCENMTPRYPERIMPRPPFSCENTTQILQIVFGEFQFVEHLFFLRADRDKQPENKSNYFYKFTLNV